MNILIVDDHATNRKLLRAQLEAESHGVLEAADGVEALQVLEREPVDGVVSDILMPNMDGFRFCLEVRKRPKFNSLPFVFYTSTYDSPTDRQLAQTVGADRYIAKPAPTVTILEALQEAAAQQQGTRPSARETRSDTTYVLKQYNATLVAKLEERNIELTERNQALQQAERQLHLQATALETAANAILITDRSGAIQWVNPTFTTLTGYTTEEVIGKTPRVLKSGRHDTAFYRELWKTILSGQTWRGEFTNRRKDGSHFYDEHTITPFRSQRGEITHFIGILHDATERKQAEEKLKRQAEDLARSNVELTRFNRAGVGRELRMVELKREVNELSQQLGRLPPYDLSFIDEERKGFGESQKQSAGNQLDHRNGAPEDGSQIQSKEEA